MTGPHGTRELVQRLSGTEGAFARALTARPNHPKSLEIDTDRGGKLPRPWPDFTVTEFTETGTALPHTIPGTTGNGFD